MNSYIFSYVASFVFMLIVTISYAQQPIPNEIEIKNSGDFVWEQLIGADEESMKKTLADAVWHKIELQNLLKQYPGLKKEDIRYLIKPRGKSFYIVGYISKKPRVYENASQFEIKPNSSSFDDSTMEIADTLLLQEKQNGLIIHVNKDTVSQSVLSSSQLRRSSNNDDYHSFSEETTQLEQKSRPQSPILEDDSIASPISLEVGTVNNVPSISHSRVGLVVSKIDKCLDVMTYLNKEKKKGNVFYDSNEQSFDKGIANCLVLVCDINSGNVVHFLAVGEGKRLDYISGNYISIREINQKTHLKKLYIYEIN